MGDVPWTKIKKEYVTKGISYRALAKKYGVCADTISKRGKAEGWVSLRKEYQDRILAKSLQKEAESQAAKLCKAQELTEKLIDRSLRMLEEEIPGDKATGITPKKVNDLSESLTRLVKLTREFYNLPTPAEAEAQRIAAERLNLDRKRAEPEKQDTTIQIDITGLPEDWMG